MIIVQNKRMSWQAKLNEYHFTVFVKTYYIYAISYTGCDEMMSEWVKTDLPDQLRTCGFLFDRE